MAIALDQGGNLHLATESRLDTYDPSGNLVRSVPHIGSLAVADVLMDSQDNVLLAGSVFDPQTADRDYYAAKFSPGDSSFGPIASTALAIGTTSWQAPRSITPAIST